MFLMHDIHSREQQMVKKEGSERGEELLCRELISNHERQTSLSEVRKVARIIIVGQSEE